MWYNRPMPPKGKQIYALVRSCHEAGLPCPSVRALAAQVGLCPMTTSRYLSHLVRSGWLRRVGYRRGWEPARV